MKAVCAVLLLCCLLAGCAANETVQQDPGTKAPGGPKVDAQTEQHLKDFVKANKGK